MVNAISTLVGNAIEGRIYKWHGALAAANGSIYGIPALARRVLKFNSVDKSMTYIGPDFGGGMGSKWKQGAMTDSGIIYCAPWEADRGILKIDTNTDTVTELNVNLLPERGIEMWDSCAAALDGCVYFMPNMARRIMKIDPNNNDAMTSVGDDLGNGEFKYSGTVVGIDGCVYGLPNWSKRIIKYDLINGNTTYATTLHLEEGMYCRKGALGRDGCIYTLVEDSQLLKIDTANNSHCFVQNRFFSEYNGSWGNPILGIDGCIYCPPMTASRIMKYDPYKNQISLVGVNYDELDDSILFKWECGALAFDGAIYCLPSYHDRVLSIDPLKQYFLTLKSNMEEHPDELGFLFQTNDDDLTKTNFDCAVQKFGRKKVLELLKECMAPVDQLCAVSNLYPFMIAAKCKQSFVSVIFFLFCQDLVSVHDTIIFQKSSTSILLL